VKQIQRVGRHTSHSVHQIVVWQLARLGGRLYSAYGRDQLEFCTLFGIEILNFEEKF